jgi:hypothetical protein
MFGHDNDDNKVPVNTGPTDTMTSGFGAPSDTPPVPPIDPVVNPDPQSASVDMDTDPVVGTPAAPGAPANNDELLDLKRDALTHLTPLVSHLDQSAEEKFKTTMMMIQATDNSALIKEAYEAAKQITDEKARAQALLDIVNEINYFTHQGENNQG